jgi:HD-GYP domain-containing protein (c-di-GMP phosphodiesterase class II)
MFDILKGKAKEIQEAKPTSAQKENRAVSFPRHIRTIFNPEVDLKNNLATPKGLVESSKDKYNDHQADTKAKYLQAIKYTENFLEKINSGDNNGLSTETILIIIDDLINQLFLDDGLLELVAKEYETENYLSSHLVNVCVLALAVGMQLNYSKSMLHILAAAGLLHDVSLGGVINTLKSSAQLASQEKQFIQRHPMRSAEMISELYLFQGSLKEIIEHHHERMDGSGYPFNIKGNKINEYAKIIALVDAYEAMTHQRPYRVIKLPHDALKELLSLKKVFDPLVIKALFNKISIYPIGSLVRLNSGETAKVISVNASSILRPTILVILDSNGKCLVEPAKIDLSQTEVVYIKEPVLSTEGSAL